MLRVLWRADRRPAVRASPRGRTPGGAFVDTGRDGDARGRARGSHVRAVTRGACGRAFRRQRHRARASLGQRASRPPRARFDIRGLRGRDLQSANGVVIGGEPHVRWTLRDGDVVDFGHVRTRYRGPGESSELGLPLPHAYDPERVLSVGDDVLYVDPDGVRVGDAVVRWATITARARLCRESRSRRRADGAGDARDARCGRA